MLDYVFFRELLERDSTSGHERALSEWLSGVLVTPGAVLERFEVGDGTENLLLRWGTPEVVFCTHMDTVPPYIPPTFETDGNGAVRRILGRGSCDAKGQLFAMLTACRRLAAKGLTGFGLLLVSGEETGSFGAKAFAKTAFRAPWLVVGEPTDNRMVSASKGTKSYDLRFTGEAFHSGYPAKGVSAVDLFHRFYSLLSAQDFGTDPLFGETTWNVGMLRSDNPQNILSPELTCRLYFRTTFVSDAAVEAWMAAAPGLLDGRLAVTARGGDTPARYLTLEGFDSAPVAFGSDAPHLTNFAHKAICGPGSILTAHRSDEQVLAADLEKAVDQYVDIFHRLAGCDL